MIPPQAIFVAHEPMFTRELVRANISEYMRTWARRRCCPTALGKRAEGHSHRRGRGSKRRQEALFCAHIPEGSVYGQSGQSCEYVWARY